MNESTRNDATFRRFTIRDALILIAASALTVGLLRSGGWFERFPQRVSYWLEVIPALTGLSEAHYSSIYGPHVLPGTSRTVVARSVVAQIVDELFIELLCSVLFGLTLAQPILRLQQPRLALRDAIRQSWFAACLFVIVGSLIFVDLSWTTNVDGNMIFISIAALLLLWPTLGLPPWKTEPGWVDQLGRAVGWGWIVATTGVVVLRFL